MTSAWPKWATVRAEEVRTVLLPEEWGPWSSGGQCSRGIPGVFGFKDSTHPSEAPYFFHCRSCIEGVQKGGVVPKPHPARDLGSASGVVSLLSWTVMSSEGIPLPVSWLKAGVLPSPGCPPGSGAKPAIHTAVHGAGQGRVR